jgi:outer membrane immunogenic protein
MRTSLLGFLAGTAALAIAATTVQAADLPSHYSPAPAYNAMPTFTWTGFYVGANVGYGWSTGTSRYYDPAFGYVGSSRKGGFVGGAQAGYNYQFGMFVLGAETDLQYAAVGNKGASYGNVYYSGDSDGYFGTIRARLGIALDRALIYGTGGFAYGDVGGNRSYDTILGHGWRRRICGDEQHYGESRRPIRQSRHEEQLCSRGALPRPPGYGIRRRPRRPELQVRLIGGLTSKQRGPVATPGLFHG